jgi:hypothetical protein
MYLSEFLEFAKHTDLMPVEVELKNEESLDRVKVNRQSIQARYEEPRLSDRTKLNAITKRFS